MSFLNPFLLFGSIALAIPVLIHLVRREKSEIIPFSSLMFLLKVPKRSIRQQKMKNLLLMALRLLLLALLVGAFARPYLTQPAKPVANANSNRGTVLMLDNSYSMQYGDNFKKLKAEAQKRIDGLRASDRMAIVAFNDSASLLSRPTSDKNALKAAVDTLEPSFGGTRYYEAFTLADRVLTDFGGDQKSLVVISDFQRNGWNRSSRESVIGADVKTETVNFAVKDFNNVGIDSVIVEQPTSFTRTYTGRVIARIHNYNKEKPVVAPVIVMLDGKEVGRKQVTVSANSTALAEFTGFDLRLGFLKGQVKVDIDDPLKVDNEFLFAIERREKLNVLVVDAGKAKQSLYLKQAYTSSADLPFEVTTINESAITPEELAKHEVVIINDVPRLPDKVRDKMDELRKTGQGQLVILGENSEISWWSNYAKLPVKPLQRIFVAHDRGKPFVALTTYDRNHPIFKPFEKSTRVTLNSAQFTAYLNMEPKPGAAVLAKYEDGSPVIVESGKDDHGMLVFNSTVDSKWNDLPLKPSFLPLFHEMIHYLSRYNESKGWYQLGEGIPVTAGIENASAAVIDPKGERQALGDISAGQSRFFTPKMPGFYEIRVGPDTRMIAVNPPSSEGNLESMPPEDLLASVQRTQAESQQAGFLGNEEKDEYARRQMGWWYLLLFALLAGMAEIYIANRKYRTS
ncbi:MAG TPA: BatA domain-containing protein [Terriglobia bacterium]|nr:BatA domain-containing protein [Terriglobia bacterium]